jgi:hypothetical protein
MRITRISRETHPEEFRALAKMDECRSRGHDGEWVINADGAMVCQACREVLDFFGPEDDDWNDDTWDDDNEGY